jgi:hypothetical protein
MITDYAELLIEAQKKIRDIQKQAEDRNFDAASEMALNLAGVATMLRDQLKKSKV